MSGDTFFVQDHGIVRKDYNATIERYPPPLAYQASRLFERISSPAWTMEWSLPRYLGEAFQLPENVISTLIASNVYGLGCIRLRDDLADRETREADRPGSILLADLLYEEATRRYHSLFPPASQFWPYLETYMNEWREATFEGGRIETLDLARGLEHQYKVLAQKGAPLKIGCVAACLLADRVQLVNSVTCAVDHALAAAVLFDHAYDWSDDLAAGRFNLFVESLARFPWTRVRKKAKERMVMEAVLADKAGPYFDLIRREAERAMQISNAIPVPGLASYLKTFEAQVGEFETTLRSGAHDVLAAACDLLFGRPSTLGSMQGE